MDEHLNKKENFYLNFFQKNSINHKDLYFLSVENHVTKMLIFSIHLLYSLKILDDVHQDHRLMDLINE